MLSILPVDHVQLAVSDLKQMPLFFREKLAEQEEFAKQELIRKVRKAAALQMDKYQGTNS